MSQTKVCDVVKKGENFAQSKEFIKIVRKGKYLCNHCGHMANNKENLCKPVKMKKKQKSSK